MMKFNKESAIVFNTLQFYRHDRLAYLRKSLKHASENNYYYGVNGFTNYSDGYQNPNSSKLVLLANPNINNYYYKSSFSDLKMEYLNLLFDKLSTDSFTLKYERIDGTVYSTTQNLLSGVAGTDNLKIPITPVIFDSNFVNGCKVTIILDTTVFIFYSYPIEEYKYTPVRCSFINRYGGWKDIIFFKQQTNSISVKNTNYKTRYTNLIDANNLIDAFTSNKDINSFKVCTFNTNKHKGWSILEDKIDITNNSLKTFNFVNSMLLMSNALTVDIWHLRACFLNDIKINNASIGKIAYKQIKELTLRKAANVGLKGYEYQAILWITTQEYINNNFRNK